MCHFVVRDSRSMEIVVELCIHNNPITELLRLLLFQCSSTFSKLILHHLTSLLISSISHNFTFQHISTQVSQPILTFCRLTSSGRQKIEAVMHQDRVGGARRKAREEEERQDATNSLQVRVVKA